MRVCVCVWVLGGALGRGATLSLKGSIFYLYTKPRRVRTGLPNEKPTHPNPPPQVRKEIVQFLDEPHQIIDCLGVMNTLGGGRWASGS